MIVHFNNINKKSKLTKKESVLLENLRTQQILIQGYLNCFIGILLGNNLKLNKNKKSSIYKQNKLMFHHCVEINRFLDLYVAEFTANKKKQYILTLIPHKKFFELRKEFYNDQGKKIIPKTIDNYMSIEFLFFLYLENGYLEEPYYKNLYAIDVSKYDMESIINLKNSIEHYFNISLIIKNKQKKITLLINKEEDNEKIMLGFLGSLGNNFKIMKYKIDRIFVDQKLTKKQQKEWIKKQEENLYKPGLKAIIQTIKEIKDEGLFEKKR